KTRSLWPFEDQTGIGAAKAEGIRQHELDRELAGLMRHEVNVGVDRQMVEVERRRNDLISDRQYGKNRFDCARSAEEMPDRRFCRGHREGSTLFADNFLNRPYLNFVAKRRRGAMRIDVIDIAG